MDTEKLFVSVEVLYHSSIRITGEKTVYVDPFGVDRDYRDADLILITHDHFDHFSPDDIARVRGRDTVIVTPVSIAKKAGELGFGTVLTAAPGDTLTAAGLSVRASSMSTESTSSTMAKWCLRCTRYSREIAMLSRR